MNPLPPIVTAFTLSLILCCTLSLAATNPIHLYTATTVKAGASYIPLWANYDSRASLSGNVSSASEIDDGPEFDPIGGFCMPYFQMESVSFFISPNGYLSLQPSNQCQYICSGDGLGNVKFSVNSSSLGDFTLIGLYVYDLNPSSGSFPSDSKSNHIYKLVEKRSMDDGMGGTVSLNVAIVEYYKVRLWTARPSPADSSVTAAVELWENGTIIFRYKDVLKGVSISDGASTGLIWTKEQRISTVNVLYKSSSEPTDYIAIRYEPTVNKTCSIYSDCNSCASAGVNNTDGTHQWLSESDCVWCGNTNQCVPYGIVTDFCGLSDRNVCLQNQTVLNQTTAENVQLFYRTKVTRKASWSDIRLLAGSEKLSSGTQNVSLGFNFSFFNNPPNLTDDHSRTKSIVTVLGDNFLSVLSSTQPCSVTTNGLCGNADYSFSIVPFGILYSVQPGQTIYIQRLPARNNGDLFCNSGSTCGKGIVFQFSRNFFYSTIQMSFQVYLGEDNSVVFHYHEAFNQSQIGNGGGATTDCVNGSRTSWDTYIGPYIGLYREGSTDPSSATFPWSAIEKDTRVHFIPVDGCEDCNGNGACNLTSRVCECQDNFVGSDCAECAEGYYGPSCAECRTCLNGGVCYSGVSGSGYCNCPSPFSGKTCSETCESSVSCPDGCGQGYCLCGTCNCDTDNGWKGTTCSEWEDPCPRWSLDGCSTCVSHSNINCNFCSADRKCFASSVQSMIIGEITTSCKGQYVTPSTSSDCTANTQSPPPDSTFAIITVIVVFACLGVCACLTLITVCACRKRPPNPHSISAVPGVPDFAFPHREREIMGVSRLPIQGRNGRPVQGIPLKQIQLSQLVKIQREARARHSDPSNYRKTNFPEQSESELAAIGKGIPVYVD